MNKGVDSMNKMMEMYSPSHKKRVMAEVVEGYAQNGKGGSPRLALKGLFEGKKTLPKKVDAETFEKYGFNAEETIAAFHAESVGEPLPESPLEDAPSTVPSPIEPTNANFSADNHLQGSTCNYCGSDNIRRIKGYKCMNCANEVNYHAEDSPSPSGPSEEPEPAEATGSEPSNANFSSEEAVYIKGKNSKKRNMRPMFYQVGQEDSEGFIPEKIVPIRTMNERGTKKLVNAMKGDEGAKLAEDSPSPSGPSEEPEPAEATGSEPSNESFSAEYEVVMRDVENLSDDDYVDFCYHWGIDPDDMDELSSFVMKNKDSPDVQGWITGRMMGFDAESLVEEPAWIPAGDGRALGQQTSAKLWNRQQNAEDVICAYCEEVIEENPTFTHGEIVYHDYCAEKLITMSDDDGLHERDIAYWGTESQKSMILEACGICDKEFNTETLNADGYCGSCCDTRLADFDYRSEERVSVNNEFDAESNEVSKNAQIAIGLTALGVGLALWKSDSIMNIIDKIKKIGE